MDNVNVTTTPKKKIVFPKYAIILLIISAVLFGAYLFVKILENYSIYLYLFGLGSYEISVLVMSACVISLLGAVAIFVYKNSVIKILVVIIMAIVIVYVSFWCFSIFLLVRGSYDEFTSSDKEHTIVIHDEDGFDLSPHTFYSRNIYEKTSFGTMKKVGDFSKPISLGDYYLVWNEDNFKLHFENGTDDDAITIDYIK
ncbi:MAG: hypothetical protein E7574_05060 [Ruminococcaceae bacterium]|nr:hypothetical protein [Oscillospiraceae bacterium]